jgi:uncharacterized membrane protein YgcG
MRFRLLCSAVLLALTARAPRLRAQSPGLLKLFPETPEGYVTDQAQVLDPEAEARLSTQIDSVRARVGGYIAVVTLPTIGTTSPTRWPCGSAASGRSPPRAEIGDEHRDLGAVILVVPKTAEAKGRCYVATARGAEGFITDAAAADMCRDAIPHFKDEDYAAGISSIVTQVGDRMYAEIHPPPPPPPTDWTPLWWILGILGSVGGVGGWFLHRAQKREEEAYQARRRRDAAAFAKSQAERERQLAVLQAQEDARWNSLTPDQQAHERRRQQEQHEATVAAALSAALSAAALRRKRDEEEDQSRSSYSSYSSSDDSSSSSSSSSSDSSSSSSDFGGSSGFSGGGGGRTGKEGRCPIRNGLI